MECNFVYKKPRRSHHIHDFKSKASSSKHSQHIINHHSTQNPSQEALQLLKMKLLALLAALTALAAANGEIELCSSSNGGGTCAEGSYVPPANCNGGCVEYAAKSADGVAHDSGYICESKAPFPVCVY
jgi:hypothetical protein